MPAPSEPTYIVSLDEIFWGGILVALTLIIHSIGMLAALSFSDFFQKKLAPNSSFIASISNLIFTSWIITAVHLIEVMMWAAFFQWNHCFSNYSTASYFALMEYTTVGSQYDLPQRWRLLEGMVATAGLLGFAWSTGVLMTLAQAFQTQTMQRLQKQRSGGQITPE